MSSVNRETANWGGRPKRPLAVCPSQCVQAPSGTPIPPNLGGLEPFAPSPLAAATRRDLSQKNREAPTEIVRTVIRPKQVREEQGTTRPSSATIPRNIRLPKAEPAMRSGRRLADFSLDFGIDWEGPRLARAFPPTRLTACASAATLSATGWSRSRDCLHF
jgi:hypothetical protein